MKQIKMWKTIKTKVMANLGCWFNVHRAFFVNRSIPRSKRSSIHQLHTRIILTQLQWKTIYISRGPDACCKRHKSISLFYHFILSFPLSCHQCVSYYFYPNLQYRSACLFFTKYFAISHHYYRQRQYVYILDNKITTQFQSSSNIYTFNSLETVPRLETSRSLFLPYKIQRTHATKPYKFSRYILSPNCENWWEKWKKIPSKNKNKNVCI